MPLVKREDVPDVVALRENDDGGVGEPNLQIREPVQDHECTFHIGRFEYLEPESTTRDLLEKGSLGGSANTGRGQIIQLGEDEPRRNP